MVFLVKLREFKGQYAISIPPDLVKRFGWHKGMELSVVPTAPYEKKLLIEPMPGITKELETPKGK